jgi:predicted CoA-binding protein
MLGNQLAYFDDMSLKIFVMEIFDRIFDRSHAYEIHDMKLPFFLPPSCGGLGYPVATELFPRWVFPMIGYILECVEEPSISKRAFLVQEIKSLNKRLKHGMDYTKRVLRALSTNAEIEWMEFHDGQEVPTAITPMTIYSERVVRQMLESVDRVIPVDPYTGNFDRDHLHNEAVQCGFRRYTDYLEQIERTINFDGVFREENVRQQRTFEQWVRKSKTFWMRTVWSKPVEIQAAYTRKGREGFTSLSNLEQLVDRCFDGYCYPSSWISIPESGPSLTLPFRELRQKPQTKFFGPGKKLPLKGAIAPPAPEDE